MDKVVVLAEQKGVQPAQLALAWVLAQRDFIVPIFGTRHATNLEQNLAALDVTLSPEELAAIDEVFPTDAAAGTRYPEAMMHMVNA